MMSDKIVEVTPRGFEYIRFDDRYGDKCRLQQSSLAEYEQPGTSAVWLGLESDRRMHLDREQVEWLIRQLSLWLETGGFREQQDDPTATDPAD